LQWLAVANALAYFTFGPKKFYDTGPEILSRHYEIIKPFLFEFRHGEMTKVL
jgi:hypothetical protein